MKYILLVLFLFGSSFALGQDNMDEQVQLIIYRIGIIKNAIDSNKYVSKFVLTTENNVAPDLDMGALTTNTKTISGFLCKGDYAKITKDENGGGTSSQVLEAYFDSKGNPFAIVEEVTKTYRTLYVLAGRNITKKFSSDWSSEKFAYDKPIEESVSGDVANHLSKTKAEVKKMYGVLQAIGHME